MARRPRNVFNTPRSRPTGERCSRRGREAVHAIVSITDRPADGAAPALRHAHAAAERVERLVRAHEGGERVVRAIGVRVGLGDDDGRAVPVR